MKTVFIVMAQDILSNYVYPIAGYSTVNEAKKRLKIEKRKNLDSKYRLWVEGVTIEPIATRA